MKKLFFLILFMLAFVTGASGQGFNWLYNYERPQNGGSTFYLRTVGGGVSDTLHTINATANVSLEIYTTRKYMTIRPIVTSGGTVDVDVLIQFAPVRNGEEPTDGNFKTFSALTTTLSATGTLDDIVFDTSYPTHDRWRVTLDGQGSNAADTKVALIFSARDK